MIIYRMLENQKKRIQIEKNKELSKNVLAGIVIGSALGILFAPKSGEDTRAEIKDKSKEIEKDIKNNIEKSKKDLKGFKETLNQIKSDIKDRAELGIGPVDKSNYTEIQDLDDLDPENSI